MKIFIISKNILAEDTNTYQMTLQTTEVPNSGRAFQNHITACSPIATYIKHRHQSSTVISSIGHHPRFLNCGLQLPLHLQYHSINEFSTTELQPQLQLHWNTISVITTQLNLQFKTLAMHRNKETYTPSGLPLRKLKQPLPPSPAFANILHWSIIRLSYKTTHNRNAVVKNLI